VIGHVTGGQLGKQTVGGLRMFLKIGKAHRAQRSERRESRFLRRARSPLRCVPRAAPGAWRLTLGPLPVRPRATALLLLCLAFAAVGAERPLARFQIAEPTPSELAPLLQKVLDSAGPAETADADAEDDERLLRRLRAAVLEALATEGYFSPHVDSEPDATHKARYVLRLEPGPRAQVADVQVKLTGAIQGEPERVRQLVSSWELDVGKPFRAPDWAGGKTRLLNRVRERDFAAARIADSIADVDVDTATVRLRVEIDSGPAFTLGPLEVKGLKRYEPQLVERYNPFKPGDRYDAAKLLELQRKLQQTPYFASVIVDVDETGAHENVPIRIEVTEAQTKRVAFGGGFSTDTGLRAEVTYRQSLLFDHPYTLSSGAGIDRTRAIAFADILLPPKSGGTLDSVGVLRENTDIENVLTRRWAMGVRRATIREAQGVTHETRLSLTFENESRRIADSSEAPENNDVVATTYTWTRRAVDQITNPTKGDLLTLSGTLGLQRTASGDLLQQSFIHLYGRYVRYVPLTPRDQLILRGEAGHVWVDDPAYVPNDYLFRTGGIGSVRGYAYESLGVREGTATTGSRSLLVGSAEYVRWLNKSWGAAAFYDAGDANDDLRHVRLARGYGLGARWRTLAGPIALDVAYGEREKQWRIHFFIAIAY